MIWTNIMIHHSLTKDGDTVSAGAIEDYHVKTNGWSDVGYHALVERINGRLYGIIGRDISREGAHCKEGEMNRRALGVCVVGNFDLAPPDDETLDFLVRRVLKPWMRQFAIDKGSIVFHRDYATYKSCPGTKFTKDMLLRRL